MERMFSRRFLDCMKNEYIYIYGAGQRGKRLINLLKEIHIPISAVVDRDSNKIGTSICGYPVINKEDLCVHHDRGLIVFTPHVDTSDEQNYFEKHSFTVMSMNDKVFKFLLFLYKSYSIFGDSRFAGEASYFIPPSLEDGFDYKRCTPFSHYGSPYTSQQELIYRNKFYEIDDLCDLDLNVNVQRHFLNTLPIEKFYDLLNKEGNVRYTYKINRNMMFGLQDALTLAGIINKYMPRKIIEIGSGFSTAVALDVNDHWRSNAIQITCIEPNSERLRSLLKPSDNIKILEKYVQEVPLECFEQLEDNDILFIDSSHIAKSGGDVPYEFFGILPRLKKGVIIHIHDICYKFEYPIPWLKWGWSYSEAYVVRALLSGNQAYEILFHTPMWHAEIIQKWKGIDVSTDGDDAISTGGSSLWIKKSVGM